jgi:opacity protein-like surface antigen
MKKLFFLLVSIIVFIQLSSFSQEEDLMDLLIDVPEVEYTNATFKTTLVVIGQSVENPPNGNLIFNVQHRFGPVNSGWYDMWGLDMANTRLGFQYGINDWIGIGIGRSTLGKELDGNVKVKILRQSKGLKKMPISVSYFGSIAVSTLKWQYTDRENYFSSRMSYANQLLIARKMSPGISLQLMPTMIHRNLVDSIQDDNDVWAVGAGGRFKISNRVSVNLEYYYVISEQTASVTSNSFSIGFDLETGGHVFQLYMTNSVGIIEEQFIPRTEGKWTNGDIHIGFNISRAFVIKKPKEFKKD